MAITYTDNGGGAPTGSDLEFTYSFPVIQTEDVKVSLNGVTQATTKYTVDNVSNPTKITFNNTSVDSSVQNTSGAPKLGVRVRVYRETTVGKANGDEDPKAVFAAGSSIRAIDLNANQEQALFAIHELQSRPIETEDLQNLSITSDKIADGTIQEVDIANSAVTSNKIADNAVTTTEILNGAVTRAKLEADIIDGTKLEDNAVNSEHYTDGSIDRVHLSADIIDSTKLEDNAVNSEHYVDGSIDHVHLANDIIDGDNIQDDVINSEHIVAGALDNEHYAAGSITADKLNGATVVTNSEQAASTPNDTSFFTTAAAEARYFNASTGETIKDGQTFPDNDTTIATTAAINDRIIDLVDDVGGFVPIANETSFPTSNPDVNDGAGTIVSVSAASTNLVPSGTTVTIANGRGTGLAVIITGVSATIPSGFGFLVETTTTDHTYTFHRLSPKATEVTTVAGQATEISRLGTAAAVEDMSILGTTDVVADMAILGTADVVSDLNTLGTADVVADMNTLAVTSVVNNMDTVATNIANVNTTAGSISNVNTTAGSISNVNTVAGSIANVNTTAGSIANVNTAATNIASINNASANISSVNNFGDTYQVSANDPTTDGGGNTLAAGDLYFNTSADRLKVYDGSAWVNGVEISGAGAVTTGNTFTGDNRYNDGVKALFGTGSDLQVYHTGTESLIQHTGPGVLKIEGNGSNNLFLRAKTGENSVKCAPDSDVELYFDNSKKLETTSSGISVTGRINASERIITQQAGVASLRAGSTDAGGAYLYLDGDSNGDFSGSDYSYVAMDDQGRLRLNSRNPAQSGEILFSVANGAGVTDTAAKMLGGGAVELYYANDMHFATTADGVKTNGNLSFRGDGDNEQILFNAGDGSLKFNDDTKIKLGNGADLQIYHSGSGSYIRDVGTGTLYLDTNGNDISLISDGSVATGRMGRFFKDAQVELYHDNNKKFETTTAGIDVTGTTTDDGARHDGDVYFIGATSGRNVVWDMSDNALEFANSAKARFGNGNDLEIYHDGTHNLIDCTNSNSLFIQSDLLYLMREDGNATMAKLTGNGSVELYYNNGKKFETISDGAKVTGRLQVTNYLEFDDNVEAYWGNSHDLQIYHDGTNNIINSSNGNIELRHTVGGANEPLLKAYPNNAVELYYDNDRKVSTVSNGVRIESGTGDCQLDVRADENVSSADAIVRVRTTNTSANSYLMFGDSDDYYVGGLKYENANDKLEFIANNAERGSIDSNGKWHFNSHISLGDNSKAIFGGGSDLQIYHDGQNSVIRNYNNSASLYIQPADSENGVKLNPNGSTILYYDNSQKLGTNTNGVTVSGQIYINNSDTKIEEGSNNSIRHLTNSGYVDIGPQNSSYTHYHTDRPKHWFNTVVEINGNCQPHANNSYNLGSSSLRWANVYTNDLHLSNEGSSNDVDGSWGDWTIQEGESDLFLKNNRSGKKYKFNLSEVA